MEVIQILIFVFIVAIAVIKQLSKAKKETETTRSLSDSQSIEVEMEDEVIISPVTVPRKVQRPVTPPKQKSTIVQSAPKAETPHNQSKIKLSTREEARRAFLYSEIFKRKY